MSYQIYIPRAVGANLDNLRAVGLEDLIPAHDEKPQCGEILKGPDGNPGQLWGWLGQKSVFAWNETHFTATPCVKDVARGLPAGRFWWVLKKGENPTEEILRRSETYQGKFLKLDDGAEWLIPNVLALPETFGFDNEGEIIRVPKLVWKPFVDDAEWVISEYFADMHGEGERDWKRELETACRFLSANYRVNRELIIKLGLVTPQTVLGIMMHAVDPKRLQRLVTSLKNPTAGPATPTGLAAFAG